MKILGLDISSSKIGIALLEENKILVSEVLKFKQGDSLEERAVKFEKRMKEIEHYYMPYKIYVEQPALMFKGGKTTAFTMAKLQRFNGMCCYAVRKIFGQNAILVNPTSARAKLNIKIPRGLKGNQKKTYIVEQVAAKMSGQFKYNLTYKGNPQPGTDDRADAIVMALAGPLIV
jgi:Holliday junction resolvasome RuvABC endonuclease subunit